MGPARKVLHVGLISGTSMDGIDAALVHFGKRSCEVLASQTRPYDDDLRQHLLTASRNPAQCTVDDIGMLDRRVGVAFRDAAVELLDKSGVQPAQVAAIGSLGQTLRHQPRVKYPFTLQIGDPNVIAAGTGITTVADFRRRDLAIGGEGAPLAPAFHYWLWGDSAESRAVLNIGGFANLTVLAKEPDNVHGFDTGPGNSLMDAWCQRHLGQPFDSDGAWSATGTVCESLLDRLLADPYFRQPPPKSTGFEYFNTSWLDAHLSGAGAVSAADVQATLCELTARTISDAVSGHAGGTLEVMVCGGGAHNRALLDRVAAHLPGVTLSSTEAAGVGPDWVEAVLCAWLAARCIEGLPGNLPSVTGADKPAVLGCIYPS